MQKILIAVDGSETSLDAVRHAIALRDQGLRASLVLVNVQEPPTFYEMLTVRDPDRLAGLGAGAGEHLLQEARNLCDSSGIDYEFEVASGDPAHTLADVAERYGCTSIVVGASGKGGTADGWLGSVSHELIHVSNLPVTVIKHIEVDLQERQEEQQGDQADQQAEAPPTTDELQPVMGLA
ncbi:MAG: universal stress protein [Pseudomonadota bacterium]